MGPTMAKQAGRQAGKKDKKDKKHEKDEQDEGKEWRHSQNPPAARNSEGGAPTSPALPGPTSQT